MEVSNVRDHVTHAVISGGKTIDFGISDSPEFFHILSSTLYSDQPLAVAREVLCNAWDAHIEAGIANRPVEVTLTEEELIIRDFGTGISDDDIGPIYGVYGGSTKKQNAFVTGGFGLGCKAPFAYTDHFEVISWHAGRKTIYNMSKSSAEVMGRPGIVPIASFPSDETGLQVRIQLKNKTDQYTFSKLIRRIASNGEMSVLLNGEPIDVLPFSSMKNGFMMTCLPVLGSATQSILVRYGHVIYPVEDHDDYHSDYRAICKFLETLPNHSHGWNIVFQAKPNSISVTPSRESLSMQEHTIKTLTEILRKFREFLDSNLEAECFNLLESSIVEAWTKMRPAELFKTDRHIPCLNQRVYNDHLYYQKTAVELPSIVKIRSCHRYPEFRDFRYRDLLARVNSLIEANFGNAGLLKSYRSELIRLQRRKRLFAEPSTWLHRKIIAPLVRDLTEAGLPAKRLTVYSRLAAVQKRKWNWEEDLFNEATQCRRSYLELQLPFLRNIVVLCHNRESVQDRIHRFPIMKNWLGGNTDVICYMVPRTSKKLEEIRNFFRARGVILLDLTVYHPWEKAPVEIEIVAKEKAKPKPKGLPILGSLLNGGIRMDFLDYEDKERDIKRTEKPQVVAQLARGERRRNFKDWSIRATTAICHLWPNEIGISVNSPQTEKYIDSGAIPLDEWVVQHVCTEVTKNKRIQREISLDYRQIRFQYDDPVEYMLSVIYSDPELRNKLRLTSKMTETDRHYYAIWRHIKCSWSMSQCADHPEIGKTFKILEGIEMSPVLKNLHEKMETVRPVLRTFDTDEVRSLLSDGSTTLKPAREMTKRLVLLALKG